MWPRPRLPHTRTRHAKPPCRSQGDGMTNHTGASVRPDHPATRQISLTLEAEVMADETGRLSLVASTDPQLSDIADVTPARLRDLVAASRDRLAEFERLADEQEARDALDALLAEHGLPVEAWAVSAP